MEDRLTSPRTGRPGAASLALLVILLITAAWWALALWPAGDVVPAWLATTRAACFGAVRGGLPDAGGWILLIGEPVGMLGVLFVVWGRALREDLRRIRADPRWRRGMVAAGAVGFVALMAFAQRMAFAIGLGTGSTLPADGFVTQIEKEAPDFDLTDQHGRRTSLADFAGAPAILTFAYAHCTTVCPTLVHDLRSARAGAGRDALPLLVISLDPHRDTPERLPSLAATWALEPHDRVLSGSVKEVERVLDAFGIARRRDGATGDVDHQATVVILDDGGRIVWRVEGGWYNVQALLASMPPSGSPLRDWTP